MKSISAIILAAGSGTRMNCKGNKVFLKVGETTIIEKTINLFIESEIPEIVLVIKEDERNQYDKYLDNNKIIITTGGNDRQESVTKGIEKSIGDVMIVHDGARCFLSKKKLEETILHINQGNKNFALAVKTKDTIQVVENGTLKKVLNRDTLYSMQTPQVVSKNDYLYVVNNDNKKYTDEMGLLRSKDIECKIIEGEYSNIKITTPEDLEKK